MLSLPTRDQVASAAVVTICLGLVLSCFSGNWRHVGVPFPLDRPFVVGGVVVLLAMQAIRPPFSKIALFMAATVVWILITTIVAGSITVDGLYGALDQILLPYALLLCGPTMSASSFRRKAIIFTISAIGVYCGILAVAETLRLNAIIVPAYISDPAIGLHFGRARGPFVESAADGLTLSYAFVTTCILAVGARRRRNRVLALAAASLCFAGTILTLTRECWIGILVAAIVLFVRVPPLRIRMALGGVGLASLGAAAYALTPLGAALTDRSGDLSPVWDRLNTDSAAIRMTYENPVFGVGYGNAPLQIGQYVRLSASYPVTAASAHLQPHNVLLGRSSELGVPGLVLWTSVVVFCVVVILRGARKARGAWSAMSLAIFASWSVAINLSPVAFALPNYLPFLMAGMAVGAQGTSSGSSRSGRGSRSERVTA